MAPALLLVLLAWAGPSAAAPEVAISAGNTRVAVNEETELEVSVSGAGAETLGDPEIEGIEEFETLSSSQGDQLSIVNMSVSRSKTFSYVIRPKQAGKKCVLRAKVRVGPDTYLSNRIEVETLAPSRGGGHNPAPPRGLFSPFGAEPFNTGRRYRKDDFILQARVAPAEVYAGQELTYTLAFYRGADVFSNISFVPPQVKGFWVEQLPEEERYRRKEARLGERDYELAEMAVLMYPLSEGTMTIPAGAVGFQPSPFSSGVNIKSNEITVKVLPLPAKGKPASFSGLVGSFDIAVSAPATGEKGKPLTLAVTVSGKGNVHSIPRPSGGAMEGADRFEPESKDDFRRTFEGSAGSRTFSHVVVPQKGGTLHIPPFAINFFNPKTGGYETAATKTLAVEVSENAAPTTPVTPPPATPPAPAKTPAGNGWYKNQAVWAAALLMAVAAIGIKTLADRRGAVRADERRARRLRALPAARRRLDSAALKLAQKDAEGFYAEIEHGLRGFISDLFDIPPSAVTPEDISQKLPPEDARKVEKCVAVLRKCVAARYAPPTGETEKALLDEARKSLEEADMEAGKG